MIQPLDLEFSPGQQLLASTINLIVDKINEIILGQGSIDPSGYVTQQQFNNSIQGLSQEVASKASKQYVDEATQGLSQEVASKASQQLVEEVERQMEGKASQQYVEEAIQRLTEALQLLSRSIEGKASQDELNNLFEQLDIKNLRLLESLKRLWSQFAEISGEAKNSISMVATPNYFFGESGTIHIEADSSNTEGIFDKIEFFKDAETEPFAGSSTPVSTFITDVVLHESAKITCKATILGTEYQAQQFIVKNTVMWIGAGSIYTDIFNDNNKVVFSRCLRGNKDVDCNNGDHIIIIVGDVVRDMFQRADMNGVEISFTESTFSDESGNVFRVYISESVYQQGTYNIDING